MTVGAALLKSLYLIHEQLLDSNFLSLSSRSSEAHFLLWPAMEELLLVLGGF
jgi:hypothetical protein